MGFNWIYVNPLNYPGFSGSLYSIKDLYRFNPMFSPEGSDDPHSWEPLRLFIDACHEYDIRFMMDLVINHVAIDSPLIVEHPEWFKKKWAVVDASNNIAVKFFEGEEPTKGDEYSFDHFFLEKRIANPYAIDPTDSRRITIWGDLAEIDFETNPEYEELILYWKKYVDFCLNLGLDGFRCDAAYQIPSIVWKTLITHIKSQKAKTLFLAETLGCTLDQYKSISKAGFDYIYNSSKYWDFTAPWCVEQYNSFRKYAPSVSFPESHDTRRLSDETNGRVDVQIFRYLFASIFSAGVLIPIGYEYGFTRKLNVVNTEPKDIEQIRFDISSKIKEINYFKQQFYCLNEDGEIKHFNYPNLNILLLRKTSLNGNQQVLLIYNKNWHEYHDIFLSDIREYLDLGPSIKQVYLDKEPEIIKDRTLNKNLAPSGYIIFLQEK